MDCGLILEKSGVSLEKRRRKGIFYSWHLIIDRMVGNKSERERVAWLAVAPTAAATWLMDGKASRSSWI